MTAETIVEGFAQSYGQARDKFLAAAEAAGAELHAQRHPLRGVQGEELAMDAGRLGAADAQALLIVSSACHGVEGFCGSGIQAIISGAHLILANEARLCLVGGMENMTQFVGATEDELYEMGLRILGIHADPAARDAARNIEAVAA